jgi:UDP-GlcNAc:undecaprenyl-phosphate GlcNAc-1-phosphate transferase
VTAWWTLAAYFGGAFALSLVLVPACRAVARRTGRVARPTADRWHREPTALFGGVAIVLATMCALFFIRPLGDVLLFAATGFGIFIVGFTDDLIPLKPATKLVAQLALASVLVYFDLRLGWFEAEALDMVATVFWLVAITNALNLLDNMDGLCAGVGIVAGLSLLIGHGPIDAALPQALFLAAMVGAVAGFLVYNFHPASIFMGDSGSLFIGLTLATMSLSLRGGGSSEPGILAVVAVPALVLMIPIFDMVLVTAMRTLSGRRAWHGGRDHSSHRLVAIGLPERTAVMVLWTLAALGGLAAWGVQRLTTDGGLFAVALFLASMALFAVFLTRVRVYGKDDVSVLRSGRVTTILVEFMNKRRVAEVLLDFVLISAAYYGAYRLRFEGVWLVEYFPLFLQSLPIVLGIQLPVFFLMGVYRGVWRHFSIMDAVAIGKAVGVGTLTILFAILYLFRFYSYSRAVFVIYAALLMLLATGSRASFRLMAEFVRRRRLGDRILIYGAGEAGAMTVRELSAPDRPPARLIGFADDDRDTHGSRVMGYPVLGGYDSLVTLIENGAVDQVVISTRLMDQNRLRELEGLCASSDVRLLRLQVHLESISSVS